jgi:hypothetical protein
VEYQLKVKLQPIDNSFDNAYVINDIHYRNIRVSILYFIILPIAGMANPWHAKIFTHRYYKIYNIIGLII